ncbi:MAG: protein NrnU [Burkholderiaceae bacterium]|nr:protein NrnU [Burkholderiaceae bacterium]
MTLLLIGLILFIGTHSLRIVADGWRTQMVTRLGAMPWKGLISVLSLVGFILIVKGYAAARAAPVLLWQSPVWLAHLVSLLTLVAFIFLLAAYIPKNSIKAKVGHPMVISVKIWAFSHLLANGTLADVLMFGAFLVWAVMSFRAARKRDQRDAVVRPAGELLPTLITVVIGSLIWVWFALQGHAWLIGVRPFAVGA